MKRFQMKGLFLPILLFLPLSVWAQSGSDQNSVASGHFNLGISYFNDQKYDQAVTEFQQCLALTPNDQQAQEMLESSEGISAYFKNDFTGAVAHLQKTLSLNPKNPNANLFIADAYVQLKQYPQAEAVLKNLAAISPDGSTQAAKILAKLYIDEKRYPEAAAQLQQVVKADPQDFEAQENLGVAYFQQKDYQDAAHSFEAASALQKDPQVYQFLGFSYYNLGDFDDAIRSYKKSIEMETALPAAQQDPMALDDTYFNLGVAYNDNALYDEAADAFQKAYQADPKDANAQIGQEQAVESATKAHMDKGASDLLRNQYSDAIGEWKLALKYDPNNQQAQAFIADAQAKMDKEVDAHYQAGQTDAQQGDSAKAFAEWDQALQMDPDNQKVRDAIEGLKAQKKDRIKALEAQAEDDYASNDVPDALEAYQKAAQLAPSDGKIKKRIKQIKAKQSDEKDGLYTEAMSAYGKGDLKRALEDLQEAKQADPASDKVDAMLFTVQKDITVKVKDLDADAVSQFDAGNKDQAMGEFQQVLALKSDDPTANDYVKQVTGQQSQAQVDSQKAKTLYYQGVELYINGQIREAIGKWQECLQADPGNVNAQKDIEQAKVKLQTLEKLSNG